jgi:hypothetical protein
MPLATTFWETFFLFLIFLPLAMIWAFALMDIFRREDMSGGWKAIWVLCIFLVPFFGTLVYLVFRRPAALSEPTEPPGDSKFMLRTLDDLHERGKLTDEEYAAEKARVLGA